MKTISEQLEGLRAVSELVRQVNPNAELEIKEYYGEHSMRCLTHRNDCDVLYVTGKYDIWINGELVDSNLTADAVVNRILARCQ